MKNIHTKTSRTAQMKIKSIININFLLIVQTIEIPTNIPTDFPFNTANIKSNRINLKYLAYKADQITSNELSENIQNQPLDKRTKSLYEKYKPRPFACINSMHIENEGNWLIINFEFWKIKNRVKLVENRETLNLINSSENLKEYIQDPSQKYLDPKEICLNNNFIYVFKREDFIEKSLSTFTNEIEQIYYKSQMVAYFAIEPLINKLKDMKSIFKVESNKIKISNKVSTKIGTVELLSVVDFRYEIILFEIEIKGLKPEILKKFDFFKMNKNIMSGRFFRAEEAIKFKSAMHYSISENQNYNSIQFLRNFILESIVPTLENLNYDYKTPNAYSDQLQSVSLSLTNEQLLKEKNLSQILLSVEKKTLFLNNRFYIHKTQIQKDSGIVVYFLPKINETFETFGQDYFNNFYEGLVELRDMLTGLNIFFKPGKFLLETFKWYNERPVYAYSEPLCEVLEVRENKDIKEYNESFLKEFNENIIKFQAKKFLLKENPAALSFYNFKNELIQIGENYALERIRLFSQNRLFPIRKYLGICKIKENVYLSAKTPFINVFPQNFTEQECINLFESVLSLLKKFSVKNAFSPCFDSTSFGRDSSKNLLIDLKSPDELDPSYKSPELLSGRPSSKSSSFCFGKLLEFHLMPYISKEKKETLRLLISACTQSSIIKRRKLDDILLKEILM